LDYFSAIATGPTNFVQYEMEICNKWKGIAKDIHILLPVMVMMGDMPFLNKIVGMVGGQHHKHMCHMCNIKCNDLDAPYKNVMLTDTVTIRNTIHTSPITTRNMGYYAMKENIFQ